MYGISDDARIDAVITWVNGDDPAHITKRLAHQPQAPRNANAINPHRWACNDELGYCLRSIANHAPWIGRIWIITDAQSPDLSGLPADLLARITIVDHLTLFAGFEAALPTFNSLAIETLLWRVPGLAEHFVYFNDDVFLTGPLARGDVFQSGAPVLRGAWIMERVLGKPVPPPPAAVPAIEPDTRGATTIREQLEKHRSQESCALCHDKMDPAGFALESFDVLGGWRDRYRALGDGEKEKGFGKNGNAFTFHLALPVDASGTVPGGGDFKNVRALKQVLLKDERQIARNLAQQLLVFATGSAVRFGDRPELEQLLDRAKGGDYAVRTLIHEIVQSSLFRHK
ncbi:Stealth CR1 domain-containing protein [Sandarakinorhabdus sp.]|uniref:Stealth CR1 domain-containing protein n=1 Tax=Sandarakinorhabdus sp. TaxID=1916663 RepID=UPI00356736BC